MNEWNHSSPIPKKHVENAEDDVEDAEDDVEDDIGPLLVQERTK